MEHFWLAFSFLTILPTPPFAFERTSLGQAARWFPVVGLVLGGLVAAVWAGAMWFFGAQITAVATVAGWAILTGGLHWDGSADCGDALLAPVSPERRLEILRDPRLGAFGGLTLALLLMLKVAAVASLPSSTAVYALLLAPTVARWLVLAVAQQPNARATGLGQSLWASLPPRTGVWAAVWPLLLLPWGGWQAVTAVAAAAVAVWLLIRFARPRLGGVTGDVLGLAIELVEIVVLLVMGQ